MLGAKPPSMIWRRLSSSTSRANCLRAPSMPTERSSRAAVSLPSLRAARPSTSPHTQDAKRAMSFEILVASNVLPDEES
eukprot:1845749-Pleurochrysis_carterae.AAC.1